MSSGLKRWPLGVTVHSSNPVIACLGSQYAGWTISEQESGFFALGSGPARALSRVEAALQGARLRRPSQPRPRSSSRATRRRPTSVAANRRGLRRAAADLTILYAPTGSLAGTVQIAARVLEVALHKAHELHFPLEHIVDGVGTAPIAPPIPDFIKAMGRTNDAIIYGGRVQLFVRGADEAAQKLAQQLPSSTCSAYGLPFAEIFAAVDGDFYKIDPHAVQPRRGDRFQPRHRLLFPCAAKLAPDIVDKSFR